jgi:sulfide:quinone oxidoreductase
MDARFPTSAQWANPAKVAFEQFCLRNVKAGSSEPVSEKLVMNALGITKRKK